MYLRICYGIASTKYLRQHYVKINWKTHKIQRLMHIYTCALCCKLTLPIFVVAGECKSLSLLPSLTLTMEMIDFVRRDRRRTVFVYRYEGLTTTYCEKICLKEQEQAPFFAAYPWYSLEVHKINIEDMHSDCFIWQENRFVRTLWYVCV